MQQQLSLLQAPTLHHGGVLTTGKRKSRRPLSRKRPLHLVLKAKRPVLYRNKELIERKIRHLGAKFRIKIYSVAVNFDHVHTVLKISDRRSYNGYIRALTGILAKILGAGLWLILPFSRVLAWGKDFRQTLRYLQKNLDEAAGRRPYEPRKDHYKRVNLGQPAFTTTNPKSHTTLSTFRAA